ncbi:hypothetical protein AK812_SmicGene5388 [Symbiodinium microadriaticum]|uniref:Uncharacterized protein n=1 Tax=Symbiodinium microadriaticum TaxID=2951 RepID=A0A1Q9ETU2_SYMMI|nr:hypothetical protein AK812_SmicGene5388 [Symbiodinium microadriaticum]
MKVKVRDVDEESGKYALDMRLLGDIHYQPATKCFGPLEESGKYALDMRFVHQEDGRDLDPFNGRGRVPADVGWVFPKQQLKHIHAASAVISAQKTGFGDDFSWKDAEEEKEEALKRMQVESSDESGSAEMTKKAKKVKKKLEKQKKKLEQLKQLSEQKESKGKEKKTKEKKDKKKKKKSASDDS